MELIPNVNKSHRFWVIQASAVLTVVAGLYPFIPQIRTLIPESWAAPLVSATGLAIIALRVLKQSFPDELPSLPAEPLPDVPTGPEDEPTTPGYP